MRECGFARVHGLETKELRLEQALRRKQLQMLFGSLPSGPLLPLAYTTGSNAITIQLPLLLNLFVDAHSIKVANAGDDQTGGFGDVPIPVGKQICEMAAPVALNFAGLPADKYFIHAKATRTEENPYTKDPPPIFYNNQGAQADFVDFYNIPEKQGEQIPRPDYSPEYIPEEVSELVDRPIIALTRNADTPADVYRMLEVEWNGLSFGVIKNLTSVVSIDGLKQRVEGLEAYDRSVQTSLVEITDYLDNVVYTSRTDHKLSYADLVNPIGLSTATAAGLMSSTQFTKLAAVEAGATADMTRTELVGTIGIPPNAPNQIGLITGELYNKLLNLDPNATGAMTRAQLVRTIGLATAAESGLLGNALYDWLSRIYVLTLSYTNGGTFSANTSVFHDVSITGLAPDDLIVVRNQTIKLTSPGTSISHPHTGTSAVAVVQVTADYQGPNEARLTFANYTSKSLTIADFTIGLWVFKKLASGSAGRPFTGGII